MQLDTYYFFPPAPMFYIFLVSFTKIFVALSCSVPIALLFLELYQRPFLKPQNTSTISLPFSLYSSCILFIIKRASVIPLPGMKSNCILSTTTNALILFSNTLSTIFIPCSNNFLYMLHSSLHLFPC